MLSGEEADADCYGMDRFFGIFWKCARIGERLSPYISICCILMAVSGLIVASPSQGAWPLM